MNMCSLSISTDSCLISLAGPVSTYARSKYGLWYTPARVNASTVHSVHSENAPSSPPTPSSVLDGSYRSTLLLMVRPPLSGVLRISSSVEVNRGSAADMKNTRGIITWDQCVALDLSSWWDIQTAESRVCGSSYDCEKNPFSELISVSASSNVRSQNKTLGRAEGALTSILSPESPRTAHPLHLSTFLFEDKAGIVSPPNGSLCRWPPTA
jgi:hypothetical protein